MKTRHFGALPNTRGKVAIGLRPSHDRRIAKIRELGSRIPGGAHGYLLVAALDENVGHAFRNTTPLRKPRQRLPQSRPPSMTTTCLTATAKSVASTAWRPVGRRMVLGVLVPANRREEIWPPAV